MSLRDRALTTLTASMIALAAGFGLSACSSAAATPASAGESPSASAAEEQPQPEAVDAQATLESYIEAIRPAAEAEAARYSDIYSDFSIRAEGAQTVVYSYTFLNAVDPAAAQAAMQTVAESLEPLAENIAAELSAAGVVDPVVRWVYLNPDGSTVHTIEY